MKDKILMSVIIPARNEFPNIIHTVHGILNCWDSDGFDYRDLEIIIVNNCSDDERYPQKGTGGTTDYIFGRGMYWNKIVRIMYDPIAGNHSARNKGVEIARGEYIFISDAHMSYKPGFFKSIMKTVDESGGLVHGALQFMGAYPPMDTSAGFGYTIKLGEEIKGTWNNYKIANSWFYVPAQGHWGVACKRKQFLEFGGYPEIHRCYGGGEFYLDMKWWMFGSVVVTDPNAVGYHLASGRGYSYHHDDYIHNIFNIGKALGMDEWVERAYLNYLRRGRREVIDKMWLEADKEVAKDRKFIEKRRVKSFNDLLIERPWEKLNKERHNYGIGALLIYHNTWVDLLKGSPQWLQDLYNNSPLQKKLDEFIKTNLSQFVYKSK